MSHHGKGNKKAQKLRRKKRKKCLPVKRDKKVELIDGNYSYYPVAYCRYHHGYITQGLADTHRCVHRHCNGYRVLKGVMSNEPNSKNESGL